MYSRSLSRFCENDGTLDGQPLLKGSDGLHSKGSICGLDASAPARDTNKFTTPMVLD